MRIVPCFLLSLLPNVKFSASARCFADRSLTRWQNYTLPPSLEVNCQNLSFHDRPSNAILNGQEVEDVDVAKNKTVLIPFSELAPYIDRLSIRNTRGDLKISSAEFFGNCSKFYSLSLDGDGSLEISPDALKDASNLKHLGVDRFYLTGETIAAMDSLKHQLKSVSLRGVKGDRILTKGADFTNLTSILIEGHGDICDPETFPRKIFQKSADTLKWITITKCPVQNLTYEMLKGLKLLRGLSWMESNLTDIEDGAFGDLESAEFIYLQDNQLSELSDGIFGKSRKLKAVNFMGQRIENLSKSNFSHVENVKDFRLLSSAG